MRLFTFGDLWGPFNCEHEGCSEKTYYIELSPDDNERLPEQSGAVAASYIFWNHLGKAVCEIHVSPPNEQSAAHECKSSGFEIIGS